MIPRTVDVEVEVVLDPVGVDGGVVVVAVFARSVPVAVVVRESFVLQTVAVVVRAVTELRGTRVGGRVCIVTVRPTGHVSGRPGTCGLRNVGITVGVAVRIGIPGTGGSLVNLPVAVVVVAVAPLGGHRMHRRIGVVTVGVE